MAVMFNFSRYIDVQMWVDGPVQRFHRPTARQQIRYSNSVNETRERTIKDPMLANEDIDWMAECLSTHWAGPISIDGQETEVTPAILFEVLSAEHIYSACVHLIMACKPNLTLAMEGKSETPSTSASTSTEHTTATVAPSFVGWSERVGTLSSEERTQMGLSPEPQDTPTLPESQSAQPMTSQVS